MAEVAVGSRTSRTSSNSNSTTTTGKVSAGPDLTSPTVLGILLPALPETTLGDLGLTPQLSAFVSLSVKWGEFHLFQKMPLQV